MPSVILKYLVCLAAGSWAGANALAQSLVLPPAPSGVQTFEAHGFQFVRVQANNVPAFQALPETHPIGRPFGGGTWDFAIARTELTQGQAIELPNAFYDVEVPTDQPWSFDIGNVVNGLGAIGPGIVGSAPGPQGRRFWTAMPEGENRPVRGATGFFHAAAFCNWLHNDKQATVDALLNGAYDLRNWDSFRSQTWIDVTRSPGARFFLPTYDEWAVATFYDPNRDGTGGWWQSMYGRDRLPISGAPGAGETSVGWVPDGNPLAAVFLQVAAYSDQQSPWGLFDTSGTTEEYLETHDPVAEGSRISGGAPAGEVFPGVERADFAGHYISGTGGGGFRIATSIPTPITLWATLVWAGCACRSRKRH